MQPSSMDPLRSTSPIVPVGGSRESNSEISTERVSNNSSKDTRAQKLDRIRQQIANGSYQVDAGVLAQRILGARILE